jgi:aminotransferase
MIAPPRTTDGARFVSERARRWSTEELGAALAPPALPLIDLGPGELDCPIAPHITAAVATALDRGETHYTARTGIRPLREALAAVLADESGIHYDPETEILVSSGGQEGLFVTVQMLIRPGDEVLLADPGYPSYADAVRLAGGNPVFIPIDPIDGVGLTAAAIAAHCTPRTRLLILVTPDNPTGTVIPWDEMAKIAALAAERDLLVLFDEIYKAFLFDGAEHINIATFPGMRERTVIVGSFSKGYAMTGWRIGYVAGAAALLQPITDLKLALSICSAAPSQWAALAALTGPQEMMERTRAELAERRAAMLDALDAIGLPHSQPRGAFYVFVDIRSTGLSDAECARHFQERAGVRTLPGHLFGPGGEGYLRLALVQPVPVIREAITRLAPLVHELRKRQNGQTD